LKGNDVLNHSHHDEEVKPLTLCSNDYGQGLRDSGLLLPLAVVA
jgi:hypothetical protein